MGSEGRLDVSSGKQAFTALQGQYLAFIHLHTLLHGVAPSQADIRSFFRVTPPAVHQMILTLEKRGVLERAPGRARCIRVLVNPAALPPLEEPAWRKQS